MKTLTNLHRLGRRNFFATACGLLLCVIVAVLTVSGQKTTNKPDQNLKSMARVNPSTLAMEFSLPIFSYPGRGGNGLPLTLDYSSKVWTMERLNYRSDQLYPSPDPGYAVFQSTNMLWAKFSFEKAGGWSSSLMPPILVENGDSYDQSGYDLLLSPPSGGSQFGNQHCEEDSHPVFSSTCESGVAIVTTTECCENDWPCPAPVYSVNTTCTEAPPGEFHPRFNSGGESQGTQQNPVTWSREIPHLVPRVHIQMPDGTRREFRKSDKVYQCAPEYTNGPYDDCTESTDGTYLSVDGSGMRLVRGQEQPSGPDNDVLYLPNGDRFFFPVGESTLKVRAERFTDRNGNQMSFNAERVRWTDTLGIHIDDPLGNNYGVITPVEGTQEIEVPGLVSGEPRTFELIWKNLKPVDCEGSTSDCTGNILEDFDANDDPNYELAYRGDDECQGMGPDPVSPALFTTPTPGTSWYVNGSQTIKTTDVNRPCANSFGQSTLRRFNPVVLAAVNLPNGTSYSFKYNIYGEISRITYPTGAYERFRYGAIPLVGGDVNSAYAQANRGVRERWVSFDGTTEAQHWQYKAGTLGVNSDGLIPYAVVTTAPDGTKTQSISLRHEEPRFGLNDPRDGLPVEERVYSSSCTATDVVLTGCEEDMLRRTLTELIVAPPRTGGNARAVRDPRPGRTISILFEPGSSEALATLTENTYDSNSDDLYFAHLNQTVSKEYNYKALSLSTARSDSLATIATIFATGDLARKTETDFLYEPHYKSRNLNGLPTAMRIYDGGGHLVAATQIEYDHPLPQGTTEISTWEDPGEAKRGLVTKTKACSAIASNVCTAWVETRTAYDQFGNPEYQWDANQIASNHTGTQYATHTEYSADYQYAFPTQVTTPAPDPSNSTGSDEGFVTSSTYDQNTGLVLTTTDANGQITTMEYDDPLLRPTKVIPPGGKAQLVTEYCDGQSASPCSSAIYVRTKTQVDASHWAVATKTLDPAGRPVRTEQQDSAGNIRVDMEYDSLGRAWKTSNPYRTGGTPVWTVNGYDGLGRIITVTTPDSAVVSTAFGLNTVDTAGIPLGTMTLVTDQAGIRRLALTDAGGNLTDVWEIKSSGSDTVSVDFNGTTLAGYRTSYLYDVFGKLHKVQQGSQNRYFAYDPLGRLIRAKNVEQETNTSLPSLTDPLTSNTAWAQAYTYDANGNLLVTTTARNSTITNSYDALNRVTLRNYSGTMPDVGYRYDTVTHGLGKLASVSNGLLTTRFVEYSAAGDLLTSQQEFDGVATPYVFHYAYNLSGQMVSETYPSGRVVMNTFDSEGKNDSVSSRGNGHAPRIHANAFHYNDKGVMDRLRLGNGLWEGMTVNNRYQTTQITLGTTSGGSDLLKLDYNYGSTGNNGNVLNQTITVPTVGSATGFVATQNYTYDQLNRLATVEETQYGLITPDWRQQFGYDRYGNRSMGTSSAQTFGRNSTETQTLIGPDPAVSTSTNRITNRTGELYEFDASGNMIKDALGNRSVYDIENHQTEYYYAANTGSTADARYYYDGDGKRVKKVVGTETTIFVYGAGGNLAAEYTIGFTNNPNPQTNYITTDALGSTRLVTNSAGQVVARHDYLPFGDEILGLGGRTFSQGFGQTDATNRRFTGYEMDPESGLNFAEARYYHHGLGRFTSVDPLNVILGRQAGGGSDKSENEFRFYLIIPQKWNKFIYCTNNPLRYVDPDGYDPIVVYLNIIFDEHSRYSMEEKREIMRRYFEQTKKDFANIDITFWVEQRDGAASHNVMDEDTHTIRYGDPPGAINAFFTRRDVTTKRTSEITHYEKGEIWIKTGEHIGDENTGNLTHGILHALGLHPGVNGFPTTTKSNTRYGEIGGWITGSAFARTAESAVIDMERHLRKLSNGGYSPRIVPYPVPLVTCVGCPPDNKKEINMLKEGAKRYEHKP